MRPRKLAEFVGQNHFLGEGKLLRRLLDADRLSSAIFYGPPGTGKTYFARRFATWWLLDHRDKGTASIVLADNEKLNAAEQQQTIQYKNHTACSQKSPIRSASRESLRECNKEFLRRMWLADLQLEPEICGAEDPASGIDR